MVDCACFGFEVSLLPHLTSLCGLLVLGGLAAKLSLQVPPCRLGLVSWRPPQRAQAPTTPSASTQAPLPGNVMGASGQGALSETPSPAKLPLVPIRKLAPRESQRLSSNFHRATIPTTISRRPLQLPSCNFGEPSFSAHWPSPSYFCRLQCLCAFYFSKRDRQTGRDASNRVCCHRRQPRTSSIPARSAEPISQDDGARKL
jgi:hypothetical protein